MLQASRLKPSEGKLATIAGGSSGRTVKCSQGALSKYNELVALAQQGNYWAGLVVRGIIGLTSGRLHMNNVYLEQEKQINQGPEMFYLVLPGVMATLEGGEKGSYVLTALKADTNYMQMQKDKSKPGLWRVKDETNDPIFQENGEILKEKYRSVVISDQASDEPIDIARAAKNDLMNIDTTRASMIDSSGFDLHHTPGEKGIVGLRPANQAISNKASKAITESAILLANTMYKAQNTEGVLWFSDWGGSAVLTRALQILSKGAEKTPNFKNHAIFLNRPTSNSSEALKLAKDLNFKLAGKGGQNAGFRLNEIKGNQLKRDVTLKGAIGTTGFGVSATGAALSVTGAAATVSGIVGLVGALFFVGAAVISGKPKLSGKKYK